MPNSINIQQELSQISQTVAELTEETPFTHPQPAYFEQLPSKIIQKIKELEQEPSLDFLKEIKKDTPFQIPEGYFKKFEPKVLNKNVKSEKLIRYRTFLRYAMAACLIGVIITLIKFNNKGNDAMKAEFALMEENSKSISLDAFDSYLNEGAVSGIPENGHDEAEVQASVLVEINKETIIEILQEIPENDISLYLDQDGYNDAEMMN
jgi:hypothetical protein